MGLVSALICIESYIIYIRVCALHTQGFWPGIIYTGLFYSYTGILARDYIYGPVPFIHRDSDQELYIRVCALHTQGFWQEIIYTDLCLSYTEMARDMRLYVFDIFESH